MKKFISIIVFFVLPVIVNAQIPVIHIETNYEISSSDEFVPGTFSLMDNEGDTIYSDIGIRYHGGSSMLYPKKSYRIEFWEDGTDTVTKDVSILGMRSDDDWIMIAGYIEPLRLRTKSCMELWLQMHTIYYQDLEPEAISGVRMRYAEVYLNDDYQGVYVISEKIDRKQLKLKKFKDDEIRGELYKGKGHFSFSGYLPEYDNNRSMWNGLEYQYPKEVIEWSNLYDFFDFVINSDNDFFYRNIYDHFEINAAVDYFIFINVLYDYDNIGRNLYVGRYNADEPYFYVPWDLDASLGINWYGAQTPIVEGLLYDGLYQKLLHDYGNNGFVNKVTERWNQLYGNVISTDNIMSILEENYHYLSDNGAYEREVERWPEIAYDTTNLSYTRNWIDGRLEWLNMYFGTLSADEHDFSTTETAVLYPNPASDFVNVMISEEKTIRQIEIYNANGAKINSKMLNFNGNEATISTKEMSSGLYILSVTGDGFSTKLKFVVK